MAAGIVGVLELLRHEDARVFGRHPPDRLDRALDALVVRRQHQLGPQRPDDLLAFLAHSLGHGDADAVAFQASDQGDADAGVAAGRFADDRLGRQASVAFGPFEHGQGHAVLDAPAGVEELRLGVDVLTPQPHQRRVADQIQYVVAPHGIPPRHLPEIGPSREYTTGGSRAARSRELTPGARDHPGEANRVDGLGVASRIPVAGRDHFSESRRQRRRQPVKPRRVDQSNLQQVRQVDLVFQTKRGQLHPDQGVQRRHGEFRSRLTLGDVRRGQDVARADLLAGKDDVNRTAHRSFRPVQEPIDAVDVLVNEADRAEFGDHPIEIVPARPAGRRPWCCALPLDRPGPPRQPRRCLR